jgi:hypothetical protein
VRESVGAWREREMVNRAGEEGEAVEVEDETKRVGRGKRVRRAKDEPGWTDAGETTLYKDEC